MSSSSPLSLLPGLTSCLMDPSVQRMAEFFEKKGLKSLKQDDQDEKWYQDWLDYQGQHRLYASLLSPEKYSSLGFKFDLLKIARFVEAFVYFSPSYGYSLQVTFLGIFPILMSANEALKKEAVGELERGGVFAFGLSEKEHGSDIYSSEFQVRADKGTGQFVGEGRKYYIGNSNAATLISILARRSDLPASSSQKDAFIFFALRPQKSKGFQTAVKIRTMGVKSAFVGGFEVRGHHFPASDIISEGDRAWDAVFGTVNLGKFFLGFGSIGICEHALKEAYAHTRGRVLFGKPVAGMPHIRSSLANAYARLTAMKLFAYRALDYLHTANKEDRRYLLFNSVQKAKVSTEGVKVMDALSECMGARGFETDTFFEMALRDIRMIPGLEGSTHINFGLVSLFLQNYFFSPDKDLRRPASLALGTEPRGENPYLMSAETGRIGKIKFPHYLEAYEAFKNDSGVKAFGSQLSSLRLAILSLKASPAVLKDSDTGIALGKCLATVAYGQLIAENSSLSEMPAPLVSVIFQQLIEDLSQEVLKLCSLSAMPGLQRRLFERVIRCTSVRKEDLEQVYEKLSDFI